MDINDITIYYPRMVEQSKDVDHEIYIVGQSYYNKDNAKRCIVIDLNTYCREHSRHKALLIDVSTKEVKDIFLYYSDFTVLDRAKTIEWGKAPKIVKQKLFEYLLTKE
jgi:hypothetical protein